MDYGMTAELSYSFSLANRGPLTTIFTPPSSCLFDTTLVSYPTSLSSNSTHTFSTTKIFKNHFSWGDSSCYPSTIATTDGSTRWANGYYYSPGICPSGWTSACRISTSALGFSTKLGPETTGVLCCPSDWSCVTGTTTLTAHGCTTVLSESQAITNVWAAPQPTPGVPMDIPASRSLANWTVPFDMTATCDAVPVLWQNTDIAILSLLGLPFTSTGTGSQSTTIIPTATSTPTPSISSTPKAGISTSAKVAIGVIIPVFFLALVLGIFFFFRRRGTNQPHHELPASSNSTTWAMDDMVRKSHGELDSDQRYEVDGDRQILEMGSGERDVKKTGAGPVYEMDGDGINPERKN